VIIKDKNKLQEKCSPVSVKEGEEIGVRLLHELRQCMGEQNVKLMFS